MKNPFIDFRPEKYQIKERPDQRIADKNQDIYNHILKAYFNLVENEIENLAWVVEHDRVVKAYGAAAEGLRDLQYDQAYIEEFCAELDSSNGIPYLIPGPAGLYLSALVNYAQDSHVLLKIGDYKRPFHFLGYGLPEGKTLTLQGDGGDFIGAGLNGGRLVVQGSTGNWCGAGMLKGEIWVDRHTGRNTGEWMHGGEIRVGGEIHSIGRTLFGGSIFKQGRVIAPREVERVV